MFAYITQFFREEDGAVTVDWVVLTAALVGLGVAVIATIGNGVTDKSTGLGAHVSSTAIKDWSNAG